jgi:hypothetical protein
MEEIMRNNIPTSPTGPVNRAETRRLIASDRVEGTAVYNTKREHLGKIHNFMVDKVSGQVDYAIMSFGGFLGLGSAYYPIPWQRLQYDTALGGYVVDLDKQVLQGAPNYTQDANPDWLDPAYGRRIDDYYGPTPFL